MDANGYLVKNGEFLTLGSQRLQLRQVADRQTVVTGLESFPWPATTFEAQAFSCFAENNARNPPLTAMQHARKSNAESSRRAVSTCAACELKRREHQSRASRALACFPFLSYGRAVGDESVSRNRSLMSPPRTNDFNQSESNLKLGNTKIQS